MSKRRHIDFILYEDDVKKVVFRFYPRLSSCHSFGEEPPKSWQEVYKVYYRYRVLKFYKDAYNGHECYYELFDSLCDECSIIDDVAASCTYLAEGKTRAIVTRRNETYTINLLDNTSFPFGDGVSWTIRKCKNEKYFNFELFRPDNVGFKFCLPKERLVEFGNYLIDCCEYMLAHGDPI